MQFFLYNMPHENNPLADLVYCPIVKLHNTNKYIILDPTLLLLARGVIIFTSS